MKPVIEADQPQKILIVDDTPANLDVLFTYLKIAGYKTLVATNGEMAIKQLERIQPDLILLDIMMPGIDGFETCRRIRENPQTNDIPIIFMTALSGVDDKVAGFEAGAMDYITKPFQQAEVLARISKELTVQKQKKELEALTASLEESNAAKNKFFSIIAHDLRSGFSPLLLASTLLDKAITENDTQRIKTCADILNESSNRLFKLLQNLLDWARLQLGKMECNFQKVNLKKLILKNVSLYAENANQKKIDISFDIDSNPPIEMNCDVDMIDTVIRNLLSNAIKFTSEDGNIMIKGATENNFVVFSITDSGIGIDENIVNDLFSIHVKHKETGTAGEQGTGLGLILCKDLIEKNKGEIGCHSKKDQGTTFWFKVPQWNDENNNE